MKTTEITKYILEDLATKIGCLSEADISKINEGTHELTVRVIKKKVNPKANHNSSPALNDNLFIELQKCQSREDGLSLVTNSLKNKKELEQFAKFLDISVLKQDKASLIRDKIIEATIGATLRSKAIQGKKT